MYMMLGTIGLDAINITDFSESHGVNFVEHAVLKGKPRLQALGEGLLEAQFSVRLHYQTGNVQSRYQALMDAKAKQEKLALIWGQGEFKGYVVITDISSTSVFTDKFGKVLCRECSISLKEYVGDDEVGMIGHALQFGNQSILGSILPNNVSSLLNEARGMLAQGIDVYHTTQRHLDNMMSLINPIENMLSTMPSILSQLGSTLGRLTEFVGLADDSDIIGKGLGFASQFFNEMGGVTRELTGAYQLFNDGFYFHHSPSNTEWLFLGKSAVEKSVELVENLSPAVADMTSWLVLRQDDEIDNKASV